MIVGNSRRILVAIAVVLIQLQARGDAHAQSSGDVGAEECCLTLLLPVGARALALGNHALVLALLAFLVWRGSGMAAITADTYATGSGLNMGVVYAALPVGAAIGCLYVVLDMVAILRGADPLREPEVGV